MCPVGGKKDEQKSKMDKGKQTGCAPIRHPCVCTCRVQQMELLNAELESGEDNWTTEATNKEGMRTGSNPCISQDGFWKAVIK